jgi:hypothetical protein
VRRFVDGRSEGFKVGDALLILDHDLAINQGSLTAQVGASIDNPAIWSGPISAGAGVGPNLALVDDDQGAMPSYLISCIQPSPEGGSGTRVGISSLIKPRRGCPGGCIFRLCRRLA